MESDWALLPRANPTFHVSELCGSGSSNSNPSDDCSPGWHLHWDFLWAPKPELLSWPLQILDPQNLWENKWLLFKATKFWNSVYHRFWYLGESCATRKLYTCNCGLGTGRGSSWKDSRRVSNCLRSSELLSKSLMVFKKVLRINGNSISYYFEVENSATPGGNMLSLMY